MQEWPFKPLEFEILPEDEMQRRALAFYRQISRRRSVREFADRAVPRDIIENAIRAAGSAPSGANMQPWHFVAVADPALKTRIRAAAEVEERALYQHRASEEWLQALAPLGTNEHKPFLQTAPWLIAVFLKKFTTDAAGQRHKNYRSPWDHQASCWRPRTGPAGDLTHTPSPINSSARLDRPDSERRTSSSSPATGGGPTVPVIGKSR
jgi:nitroreductase